MPRLIDKLDAAAGRTPEVLVPECDYMVRRGPPPTLVDASGVYQPGWLAAVPERINPQDSSAFDLAFQRWFHVSFDTERYFVVLNIAHLAKAANTAVLVADKRSGEFHHASLTRVLRANDVEVGPRARHFHDGDTGSFMTMSEDDQTLVFSVRVDDLAVMGEAKLSLGPPLIQVTRFHRGRGSFQLYGNLEVVHGAMAIDGEVVALEPGCLGLFDRTMGHQRGQQHWNWLAASGPARCEDTGEEVVIGLQVARDRERARPMVEARKYAVWTPHGLFKVPEAQFEYEILDDKSRESSDWRVTSPGCRDSFFDLTFSPRFHRRERKYLWLMNADFNQYYGELTGRVRAGERTYAIDGLFAVTEESLLEL